MFYHLPSLRLRPSFDLPSFTTVVQPLITAQENRNNRHVLPSVADLPLCFLVDDEDDYTLTDTEIVSTSSSLSVAGTVSTDSGGEENELDDAQELQHNIMALRIAVFGPQLALTPPGPENPFLWDLHSRLSWIIIDLAIISRAQRLSSAEISAALALELSVSIS